MPSAEERTSSLSDIAALIVAAALLLVLYLHLLPALLAGLLVHELVGIIAASMPIARIRSRQAKLVAVAILALVVASILTLASAALVGFVRSDAGSLPALLGKMADVLDSWRTTLPPMVVSRLPADVDGLKELAVT